MGVSFKEQLKALATKIGQALSNKVEINGDYGDTSTTVGNAKQLVSSVGVTDKVPYNFRTSGGSVSIGNRENDKIVGGTICWNQITNMRSSGTSSSSDVTITYNGNNSLTAVGTTTQTFVNLATLADFGTTLINGHVYVVSVTQTGTNPVNTIRLYKSGPTAVTTAHEGSFVFASNTDGAVFLRAQVTSGAVVDMTMTVDVFDLTKMFVSNIANYILSLDQAEDGSGAAWFKRLFPKPYYTYNPGELMSVCTNEHKMTGFNQWDEEWEVGSYNQTTGEKETKSTTIRSKNYIRVFPNTEYYTYIGSLDVDDRGQFLFFYDVNKNFIGYTKIYASNFTTPTNCVYMTFRTEIQYGATYKHDICINLSWSGSRNGEYEPYVEYSYPLDNVELRGIPKLDANNELYYDGDTYEKDGTVTRYYASRDYQSGDESLENAITDGTTTVYKLATPTTETANPFTDPQIVDDFGTEEYVDALATAETNPRDVAIPVGHDTLYQANLRDKLQNLPDNAQSNGYYVVKQDGSSQILVPLATALAELGYTPGVIPQISTSSEMDSLLTSANVGKAYQYVGETTSTYEKQ